MTLLYKIYANHFRSAMFCWGLVDSAFTLPGYFTRRWVIASKATAKYTDK